MPNSSDARYLEGLHKTHGGHPDFPRTHMKNMVRGVRARLPSRGFFFPR